MAKKIKNSLHLGRYVLCLVCVRHVRAYLRAETEVAMVRHQSWTVADLHGYCWGSYTELWRPLSGSRKK